MNTVATVELQGPGSNAIWGLAVVVILLPALLSGLALSLAGGVEGLQARWVLGVVLGLSVVIAFGLAGLVRHRGIVVDASGLELYSAFYRVHLERTAIRTDGIRVADKSRKEDAILLRTNGISFPGYRSGWFMTRARTKVFVVGAGARAGYVVVPTQRGYDLLLGSNDPARTVELLRQQLA